MFLQQQIIFDSRNTIFAECISFCQLSGRGHLFIRRQKGRKEEETVDFHTIHHQRIKLKYKEIINMTSSLLFV